MVKDLPELKGFITDVAQRIIPIEALDPASGGSGESERGEEICRILDELGFPGYHKYVFRDDFGVERPNIVLKVGRKDRTLWIISHMDTVAPGDKLLWSKPPFEATVEDDRIYGRGTLDNGQAMFTMVSLLKNADEDSLNYNIGLVFSADEETGGRYGMEALIEKGIFDRNDLFIVLDYGSRNGLQIEVAEKSVLWIKFTIEGRQAHASNPRNSINAARESMKFMIYLDSHLHSKYVASDDIYAPSSSTFEPTFHEKNVDNINTIPGSDVQFMDMRLLPRYDLDSVIDDIYFRIREFEKNSEARIKYEIVNKKQAPPATSMNSEIVTLLRSALKALREGEPRTIGIGGNTSAGLLRKKGIEAVAWCTASPEIYHRVDEYCLISDIMKDLEVLEIILYGKISD